MLLIMGVGAGLPGNRATGEFTLKVTRSYLEQRSGPKKNLGDQAEMQRDLWVGMSTKSEVLGNGRMRSRPHHRPSKEAETTVKHFHFPP